MGLFDRLWRLLRATGGEDRSRRASRQSDDDGDFAGTPRRQDTEESPAADEGAPESTDAPTPSDSASNEPNPGDSRSDADRTTANETVERDTPVREEVADDAEPETAADRTSSVSEAPVAAAVGDDPEAFREQATELADFWESYDLDFAPSSLPRLDDLLADRSDEAGRMRVELEDGRSATVSPIAASTACYFAETMVRSYDARWVEDDDYRWALAVSTPDGGEVRLNAFGIAHDGLADAPRFAVTHDALVVEVGLDGDPVADPQAEAAAAQSGPDVAAAEDLAAVAEADPEVAVAAAAAGVDADELVEGFRDDAEDLVDAWPTYELDYSPDSLERLDALVRMELASPAFRTATFGATTDETSLLFTVRTMRCAGYLAEVFRRHTDADWETEEGPTLGVEGPDGTADVDPLRLAAEALREEASLSAAYDGVVGRLGLTDAGVDVDPPTPPFTSDVEDAVSTPDSRTADHNDRGVDTGTADGSDVTGVDVNVDVELDAEDLDVDVAPDVRDGTGDVRDTDETEERDGDARDEDGDGESDAPD